jgi:hypothetical protein
MSFSGALWFSGDARAGPVQQFPPLPREELMDEDRFNMSVRKFLKHVGVTSQRAIEEAVRSGKVEGSVLKVRMTLKSDNAQIEHVIEADIDLR